MSEKKIAQCKQIENDLLEKINLGYYKKGDLIPTELELAATYQVSRVTVRKAAPRADVLKAAVLQLK